MRDLIKPIVSEEDVLSQDTEDSSDRLDQLIDEWIESYHKELGLRLFEAYERDAFALDVGTRLDVESYDPETAFSPMYTYVWNFDPESIYPDGMNIFAETMEGRWRVERYHLQDVNDEEIQSAIDRIERVGEDQQERE